MLWNLSLKLCKVFNDRLSVAYTRVYITNACLQDFTRVVVAFALLVHQTSHSQNKIFKRREELRLSEQNTRFLNPSRICIGELHSNLLFVILVGRQVLLYLRPVPWFAFILFLVIVGCWSVTDFQCGRSKFREWTSPAVFRISYLRKQQYFFLNRICAPYE